LLLGDGQQQTVGVAPPVRRVDVAELPIGAALRQQQIAPVLAEVELGHADAIRSFEAAAERAC